MNHRLNEEFNNPDKWRPQMGEQFNRVDRGRFQLALNKIFGLAPDGSPNVRIVWGQDFEVTRVFNRYSGEWYPAYLSHVAEDVNEIDGQKTVAFHYIAAPRYVIEGRVSRGANLDALLESGVDKLAMQETDRKGRPVGAPQIISAEAYGSAVGEEWEELLRIVDHDHYDPRQSYCCIHNAQRGYECWGYYRHPDAGDLKYLAAGYQQMQQAFETAPDQARTPEEKAKLLMERMRKMTEVKRQRKDEVKRSLAEFWSSKFAKLDQSVTEQAHGPFHFLSGHNSAGVPVKPKI